jgi:WD40 repeat protein
MTAGRLKTDSKPRFDAFISYSHAADGDLARALRDSLQRFATPWSPWSWANPIRSLRVFRDQSALSADPALWPAIERALAASDWFVLLASVDAANSAWIDKEVSFWCAHKPSERMLLVQTDGELAWDHSAGDFDWKVCTALPRRLAGVFADEPLWLDLRWTESQPRLDLGDPRFTDAVASIASPIRGIPKDHLIGEDIRQHRRLRRWRSAAIATLSVLLIGAIAAGEIARRQRNLALEREAEAVAERTRAERQAEIALARQLAAQSVQIRLQSVQRIELSLLLAVESADRDSSLEGAQALTQALALTPGRLSHFAHQWGAFQPNTMVLGVAYSPDGSLLASTNEDGSVALWQVGGGQVWHEAISAERLRPLAFRPDGKILAAGGDEGKVTLLRVENGQQIMALEHDDRVMEIAFDPTGQLLATASADGAARIIEVDSGDEVGRMSFGEGDLASVEDVAFSPDGNLVAAIAYGGSVCLWDVAERRESGCMFTEGHGLRLAFSPEGARIATASENFAVTWDIASGERLHRFDHIDLLGDAKSAHWHWLSGIGFSPDGQFLATASGDRSARVWDLSSRQEALRLDDAGPVGALAFSPDGRRLATATDVGTVRVWEMLTGRELFRIGNPTGSTVQALTFSPDGQQLAAGDWSAEIGIWSMRSALEGARLRHPDDVEKLAFSPDGRFIASATDDHIIRVWRTGDSTQLAEIERFRPSQLMFAEDSRHPVVESLKGGLEVLAVGEVLQARQLMEQPRSDVILTPRFALYDSGGLFDVWRAAGGSVAQSLGRGLPMDAYALHGEAALLAIAYQDQEAIEIWNIAEARRTGTVPIRSKALDMAFGPLGERLAVVHGQPAEGAGRYDPLDYRLEIRRLPGGERMAEVPLGRLEPTFIRFLPDGERLLFATGDWQFPNDLHIVDLSEPSAILTLEDVGEVHALRVAPDGEHVAISDGYRVRVWKLTSGRAVSQLPTTGYINAIGFSPDGRYLATASDDDDLTLWPWRTEDLIDRACRHLTRNLNRKEWQDFLPDTPYHPTCPNLPTEPVEEQTPM